MPEGNIDTLITRSLRAPMLTELLNGQGMKAELGAVAHEIMRRWVAKFPKESGNAVSTAKVTYHRRKTKYDNRWEAEFSAGGRRAPYVAIVEAEEHILAQVLRDMGFNTGDSRTVAPPRERKTTTVYHRTTAEKAERIEREGFRPAYREGAKPPDPNRQEYGYFTENPHDLPGYGSQVVATEVPSHLLEHDPGSGHFRVRVEHLEGRQFRREGGSEAADRAESEAKSRAERIAADPLGSAYTAKGYNKVATALEQLGLERPGRRPGSKAMERDIAALKSVMAEVEAEHGSDDPSGGLTLGRLAISSYELLKQARQARDERMR